jgi:hypothetical protein
MQQDNSSKPTSEPSSLASWWRTLLVRRHTLYVEQQAKNEMERTSALLAHQQSAFDDQINLLRARYEDEVKYLRARLQTTEDELERTRVYLTPTMQAIQTRAEIAAYEEQSEQIGDEKDVVSRQTPWQKVYTREMEADRKRAEEEKKNKKPRTEAELEAATI